MQASTKKELPRAAISLGSTSPKSALAIKKFTGTDPELGNKPIALLQTSDSRDASFAFDLGRTLRHGWKWSNHRRGNRRVSSQDSRISHKSHEASSISSSQGVVRLKQQIPPAQNPICG